MQSVWTSKVYSVHKPPWIKAKSTISNMSVLQILDVKTWTLSLKTTWNEGAQGANITHATMRDSMKGEITRSKRHLKGHRSKLSFSRLAATHGSHLDFSHTPLCSRAAEHCAANHQVINCPPPQIWRKIGKLCWALISLAIRAHFLKSPKRLPRFCHQGQEADEERRRLPNVNSHAAER